MKKIKVLLEFIRLAVTAKLAYYRNVLSKMTANAALFPNPDKPLSEVQLLLDEFETAIIAAKDGSRTAISIMHDVEAKADTAMRILAAYVDRTANGDATLVLSAGFDPSVDQPTPIQKKDLAIENGENSGSVRLVAKAVPKAGAYIWQMAKDALPADEGGWTTAGHTTRAFLELSGLSVASRYYFRVAAITSDGLPDYTAAVLKIVV